MNAAETPLPPLDDERVEGIERAVFARIGDDRRKRRGRRTAWLTAGGAAAALIVVALAVAPFAATFTGGTGATTTEYTASYDAPAAEPGLGAMDGAAVSGGAESLSVAPSSEGADRSGSRSIISSGSATVVVDDVSAAADEIAAAAVSRGGYVENVNVGSTAARSTEGIVDGGMATTPLPYYGAGDGWITVRIPTDDLDAAIADLDQVGEVTASTISRQDVTDQAVDLRARISAAETSVARLTELLAQSQTTADLIAAESALQERQATLDADRQQLAMLESQVDLASLSVQLTPRTTTVVADPAGFGDGVAAGWNGLVATLNGIVIGIGFLLPWIAILAVVGAVVWGIVTLVRRRRRRRATPPPAAD
jgi:hypothetical protein